MKDRAAALQWLEITVTDAKDNRNELDRTGTARWILTQLAADLVAGDWDAVVKKGYVFLEKKHTDPEEVMNEVRRILGGKSVGYGSDSNHLANFFEIGRVFGMHPEKVCQLLTYKHVDYLIRAEKRGRICGDEGIVSRVADIFLYSALGQVLATLGE